MKKLQKSKIIFGSAAIGIKDYGFYSLNKSSNLNHYLRHIQNLGIEHIDTAPSYGNFEKKIGNYHTETKKKFNIWTKVDGLIAKSQFTQDKINESVKKSLSNLKVASLECLYLHQSDCNIIDDRYINQALASIKKNKLAKTIGVSIYKLEELELALEKDIFDIIQLPVNVANTFLYDMAKKNKANKKIIGRSVFLQGTLLNIENFSDKFNCKSNIVKYIHFLKELSYSYKIDYTEMILSYVFNLKDLDHVILSSRNKNNFTNILNASCKTLNKKLITEINSFSCVQKDWTNPRNWII